jgi:hypothetical protein
MERDEYIVVYQDRDDNLQVPKSIAIAGSKLFEKAFNNEMKEKSMNTFKTTSLFPPIVWSTVLATL